MKPSPEQEAKGLRAYEQARAFERLRAWRLPVSYAFFISIPIIFGGLEFEMGRAWMAVASGATALFLAVVSGLHWQRLRMLYRANIQLLAELEAQYGDELPWIKMEKHFAALEALQKELAAGRSE